MAAQVDSFRHARSGSLSSGSDTGSSDGGHNRPKMKSAVMQVVPSQRKPSHSDDDAHSHSRHSSHTHSPHLHKRRRRYTPSPPSRRHRRDTPPRSPSPPESSESEEPSPKRKREEPDPLLTRTGGAYIPPAKLRMMQENISDKSSVPYQRISWEALKKSINGLINKVNVSNINKIVPELFEENVVRGRGVLSRSIIQAQAASPMFSHVYSALVSVINTKFPQTGELICKRLILQFRRGFKRNDKNICMTAVKFLAHLVNQQVLHEIAALEMLTLLMEEPTDDSVEVAVGFIKECGLKLTEVSPRGAMAMFETLRAVLHSGKISSRIQYMIEVLFAIRKDKFKDHPAVIEGLDLVEEDDQITHLLSLTDEFDGHDELNVFHPDPEFIINEEKYKVIKSEILGGGGSGSEDSGSGSSGDESSEEDEEDEGGEETKMEIEDMTESKLLIIRRNIYLTIMSSAGHEECVHKLVKNLKEGSEGEIAHMVLECCSQERSYLPFYGHIGRRLCLLGQVWVEVFDEAFQQQYATVHRLETNKLRNTAKLFSDLFYSDALPWTALSCVHLNEEETTSSSRIFVKIMFQELAADMGMERLNKRLTDPLLAVAFEGLLPRDNPKNTRFAINFFTSIGLGGLTDELRQHLKVAQKMIMEQKQDVSSSDTDSSEDEKDSSSSDEATTESSSEETSSSEEEVRRRSKHKHKHRGRHRSHKHRSRRDSSGSEEVVERKQKSKRISERQQRKQSGSAERQQRKRGGSAERQQKKQRRSAERQQRKRSGSAERQQRNRSESAERQQIMQESAERQQRKRGGSAERQQKKQRRSAERQQRKRSGSAERQQRNRSESAERQQIMQESAERQQIKSKSVERNQTKKRSDSSGRQRNRRDESEERCQRKQRSEQRRNESPVRELRRSRERRDRDDRRRR